MTRRGVCDGCGMLVPITLGVCSMCLADGVPRRQTAAEVRAEILADRPCSGPPDSFPTLERERSRVAAIRAEEAEQERREAERAATGAAENERIARENEAADRASTKARFEEWLRGGEADHAL